VEGARAGWKEARGTGKCRAGRVSVRINLVLKHGSQASQACRLWVRWGHSSRNGPHFLALILIHALVLPPMQIFPPLCWSVLVAGLLCSCLLPTVFTSQCPPCLKTTKELLGSRKQGLRLSSFLVWEPQWRGQVRMTRWVGARSSKALPVMRMHWQTRSRW
jgi:hypothetical protein